MFEFSYRLNDEDYLLFNQYHLANSATGKRSLLLSKLTVPFYCALFLFILFIFESSPMLILIEVVFMATASILWLIFFKKIMYLSLKRSMKRLKASGRLPYNTEGVLVFDDEQIQDITPNSEVKTKYCLIEKIGVTEKAIYIYFNSAQAYIVFVSAFSSEDEKQNFLRFLNSKAQL